MESKGSLATLGKQHSVIEDGEDRWGPGRCGEMPGDAAWGGKVRKGGLRTIHSDTAAK